MNKGLMKTLALLLAALMTACYITALPARAEQSELDGVRCALLADAATGKAVYEKAADEQYEFAGLVRLPALILICRAFDEERIFGNTLVTVSAEAARVRGATAFLSENERIDADSLLKAAVMLNAGDAVCALLQTIFPGGTEQAGAVKALLSGLGMNKQPTDGMGAGLTFSAREIAVLCLELVKSPSFLKYSSVYTDVLRHENAADTELVNPNRLVRHYSGCFGLATGSVGGAQYCGAFISRRGGTAMLAVVAGADTSDARFAAARALLDHGFAAYRSVVVKDAGEAIAQVPVKGGLLREVCVVTGGPACVLTPVSDTAISTEIRLPESVEAPIAEGEELGELLIFDSGGNAAGRAPLVAAHGVDKAGYGDWFVLTVRHWLGNG